MDEGFSIGSHLNDLRSNISLMKEIFQKLCYLSTQFEQGFCRYRDA